MCFTWCLIDKAWLFISSEMNGERLWKASAMGLGAKRHDLLPPSKTLNPGPGSPGE